MTLYTILEPPDEKPEKVAFVPEGFAWAALVFTFFWALWHRMWVVAALLFAVMAALETASGLELIDTALASLIQFGLALIFGFEARRLEVMSLERAGFRRAGLIQASGLEAAELAYFASRAPTAPVPMPAPAPASVPSPYRPATDDTLGIFGKA